MSANTATKIPAITQIKGLPPLAVMALQAIKETLEVREGLHEPLDRFISVRELAELILDDEKIVTYLGSGHNHDARYYTETEWNLTAKGDLNVAQGAGVPGTLGVGDNNKLIRADSGAALGIEYFSLLGTSNQVTVTHNASDATLSLPQNIHSGASPTFTALTLSSFTTGSVPFIKAGGVIGENNSAFFFEEDNGYGKLAVGDSAIMRNTFQAVREDNILVMDNMQALISVRNKGTTNDNFAGFSSQTLDSGGNVHSGVRLLAQFTSHALNAVSADMIFETRHGGSRSEKMRLSSTGALSLSNIVAGVANYDKFIVSDAGVLKYRTGAEVLSDIGGAPNSFKTITGITNDVVADLAEDSLTLATANNLLSIVGTAATDTITFTVNQGNIDHGSISGLGDSADHSWALLLDGSRQLSANWYTGTFNVGINDDTNTEKLNVGGNLMLSGAMAVYIKSAVDAAGYSSIYLNGAGTIQGSVIAIGTGATSKAAIYACYGGMYTANYIRILHDGSDGYITTGAGDLKLNPAGKISLKSGTSINEFSIDTTLTGNSDDAVPTEKAVKTYVDNTGFRSKASAYRSASQTITTSTVTKVQLNNESFDVLGEFDSVTNYRFTATSAGYYMVLGQISSANAVADGVRLITRIYKNGSMAATTDKTTGSAKHTAQQLLAIIYLAINDYVELWFYHEAGADMDILNASGDTFMTIHRLS